MIGYCGLHFMSDYWGAAFRNRSSPSCPIKQKPGQLSGEWKCEGIDATTLDLGHSSENLLKVRLFNGTICKIVASDYVLNKINGRDKHDGRFRLDLSNAATKLTQEGYLSPATLKDERQRRAGAWWWSSCCWAGRR